MRFTHFKTHFKQSVMIISRKIVTVCANEMLLFYTYFVWKLSENVSYVSFLTKRIKNSFFLLQQGEIYPTMRST